MHQWRTIQKLPRPGWLRYLHVQAGNFTILQATDRTANISATGSRADANSYATNADKSSYQSTAGKPKKRYIILVETECAYGYRRSIALRFTAVLNNLDRKTQA